MKRTAIILLALLALSLPLTGPFMLVPLNAQLAGFLHRQLAYRVIGQAVMAGAETDLDRVMAVMAFVHLNEAQPEDWGLAEDRHVLHDLLRHIGWCDQKANAMAHLLIPAGISAHMVMFPCHTLAEVMVDGRSMLFDPKHNSYFFERGMPGQLASLDELLSRPEDMLTRHGEDLRSYQDADILTCGNPRHWRSPEQALSAGRKLLNKWMGLALQTGGMRYAQAFNRWYLRISPEDQSELYRARLLDLFGEKNEARNIYAAFDSNHARFFLLRSQLESGDNAGATSTLNAFDPKPKDKTDLLYAMVLTDYLTKLNHMNGSEVMRLLHMDEAALTKLFSFLEGPEVRHWLLSQDRADSF